MNGVLYCFIVSNFFLSDVVIKAKNGIIHPPPAVFLSSLLSATEKQNLVYDRFDFVNITCRRRASGRKTAAKETVITAQFELEANQKEVTGWLVGGGGSDENWGFINETSRLDCFSLPFSCFPV